jgi:hypothetical protein
MDQALQGIAAISCGGCIARYGTAPEREPEAELPSVDGFNGQWYTTINNDMAVGVHCGWDLDGSTTDVLQVVKGILQDRQRQGSLYDVVLSESDKQNEEAGQV